MLEIMKPIGIIIVFVSAASTIAWQTGVLRDNKCSVGLDQSQTSRFYPAYAYFAPTLLGDGLANMIKYVYYALLLSKPACNICKLNTLCRPLYLVKMEAAFVCIVLLVAQLQSATCRALSTLPVVGTGIPDPHGDFLPRASFNGGPVIRSPSVTAIAYGAYKDRNVPHFAAVNSFLADLPATKYMAWIDKEYSQKTHVFKKGTFVRGLHIPIDLNATITDRTLQGSIKQLVKQKVLPDNISGNALTMIYLPPGVMMKGSCINFCAYHGHFVLNKRKQFYAVIPDQRCSAVPTAKRLDCQKGLPIIDATTVATAAMYVAAKTDPVVRAGWYDRYSGEICNMCSGQADHIKGPTGITWVVHQIWSNTRRACLTDPGRPYIKRGQM